MARDGLLRLRALRCAKNAWLWVLRSGCLFSTARPALRKERLAGGSPLRTPVSQCRRIIQILRGP